MEIKREIKRLHYFNHQFLVEADFTAEQTYHVDMRRRLNQRLYTPGIVDGLEVTKSGDKQVTVVSPGAAIDRLGREMFLEPESDQRVDLSSFPGGTSVFIIIAYEERKSDPATTGVPGDPRVTEQPVFRAVMALPTEEEDPVVPLAHFTLEANGNVPGDPGDLLDGDVREIVRPRNEQGLVSVNEVRHPRGNVNLVPGTGITIDPNQPNHSITIATQGLLLVRDYDLRQSALKTIRFTEENPSGTQQTVRLDFRPRLVLMLGTWSVSLLPLSIASFGVEIMAFAFILWDGPSPTIVQECPAINYVILSATDWSSNASQHSALFYSQSTIITDPEVSERLEVTIVDVSESGFKTMLSRTIGGDFEVFSQFKITLTLLCIGG